MTRRAFAALVACLPLSWQLTLGAAPTPERGCVRMFAPNGQLMGTFHATMDLAALTVPPQGTIIAHRQRVSHPFWRGTSMYDAERDKQGEATTI